MVDVMARGQISHTRLYIRLLAKYLASYTICLQHIEYQYITQCKILANTSYTGMHTHKDESV